MTVAHHVCLVDVSPRDGRPYLFDRGPMLAIGPTRHPVPHPACAAAPVRGFRGGRLWIGGGKEGSGKLRDRRRRRRGRGSIADGSQQSTTMLSPHEQQRASQAAGGTGATPSQLKAGVTQHALQLA